MFVNSHEVSEWSLGIKRVFDDALAGMPAIQQSAENSLSEMKWNKSTLQSKPYRGGSEWRVGVLENHIKISTRELLDLLAGKLKYEKFSQNHETTSGGENIFSLMRERRMMITASSVEHRGDEEDDWISLTLSPGDPAVNLFRAGELQKSDRED